MTILIIILGSISFNFYQKGIHNRKLFINHFYHYVDSNEIQLKNLLENKPTDERLNLQIRELEINLNKLNVLLDSGSSMIDSRITIPVFYLQEVAYLLTGIGIGGDVDVEIPPFGEDGKLDDNEISLLHIIWEDFKEVREKLYSKELMGPNIKLTINDINNIINTHFSKRASDIYLEAQN